MSQLPPLESHSSWSWFKGSRQQSHIEQNWSISAAKFTQGKVRAGNNSPHISKSIWCKVQSCTKMKAMQEGCWVAHVPWGLGKVAASSATITYLCPLAIEAEKKEQDLHSHFPSLLLQMQIRRFSDCFYAFPCFITANICRRHSPPFWAISSLNLDSPFTLLCFVVFAFLFVWFAGMIKVFLSLPSLQGWNLTGLT